MTSPEPLWILLIHQLPPKPLYLRAKIRNRLERVGALPLKNSVYVLPRSPECLEDFQWIAQEAVAGGGEAWVCEADFSIGLASDALAEKFRRAREADFDSLAQEIRSVSRAIRRRRPKGTAADDVTARTTRLEKRLHELTAIDFFGAPARHAAEMELASLKDRLRPAVPGSPVVTSAADRADLVGRTWVTRIGVQVDRIASAWLIRRFVDPDARFRFVAASTTAFAPDEVRFDMVGGEFTHEGDRCTFETLALRLGIADPAVRQISEIVHEIDLKDGRFARSDAAGVQQLLLGSVRAHPDDDARIERGAALFDDLYGSFATTARDQAGGARPAPGRTKSR